MLTANFAARKQQRRDEMVNPEDESDVHRAFFYAHAEPETYVELLEEDQTGEVETCGYLVKAMYGPRQAASAWQSEVDKATCEINMEEDRRACSINMKSDGTGLVRGDDFVIVTSRRHSKDVEDHLRSTWDLAVQTNGPEANDKKQIRVLIRTLTWRATGIECEADQRHAATLIDEKLTGEDRPVSTPSKDMNEDISEPELGTREEIRS